MGQPSADDSSRTPRPNDALSWAQIAGLVEIHPDGSWKLTELGIAGVRRLQGMAHPFEPGQPRTH
jgi:hypothetical protein